MGQRDATHVSKPRGANGNRTSMSGVIGGAGSTEDRASFLAGWAAGQAAAASCGPLPDEIARDVVRLLDTTTPAPASSRRPPDEVKDAG